MHESLFIGKNVISLETIDSTNDYAKQLLSTQKPTDGTLIIAKAQTKGRGQLGNVWQTESGKNLTASYILYPNFLSPDKQFYLNMAVALGIREFCESICSEHVQIKWPNDILINGKKVCGVLIENALQGSKIQHSIIGIGININQTQFDTALTHATSIALENNNQTLDIENLAGKLSSYLEKYYLQLRLLHFNFLEKAYTTSLWRYNQTSEFKKGDTIFKGEITGVTKEGKLEIDVKGKPQKFGFKEIEFVY
jgi:BirA family biotin operon repressor/biotin-[acetyl-CoA-carboxylase] ligase